MNGQSTTSDHEKRLVENLQGRRSELIAVLEECSSHWGFEDPIYRFYHRSFKVYALHEQTTRIVRLLKKFAPARPLNPWFRNMVEDGTGKTFAQALAFFGGQAGTPAAIPFGRSGADVWPFQTNRQAMRAAGTIEQ